MLIRDACPACGSSRYKKNGHTRHGKQNHQCKACERQCGATADDRLIADERRTMVEHLLRERVSLRGICRAVGVSLTWLLHFMVECFTACPEDLHVQLPAQPTAVVMSRLEAEADERWSFVQKQANKQWIWIAMDAKTRQIIAFHVGDRRGESGKALWAKMPMGYREQATFHTDQYDVYKGVIPAAQHKAITKQARKTNHIERFNNTLRQRVSRLVRETLSFSKTLANHIGAIKYFICHSRPFARSKATQNHWLCEQVFNWSGVPSTHLRCTFFAEWLLYIAPLIRYGRYVTPYNKDSRFAPIASSDIARIVAGILENPEAHAGKTYG